MMWGFAAVGVASLAILAAPLAAFVLLIACANIAGLVLVRGVSRRESLNRLLKGKPIDEDTGNPLALVGEAEPDDRLQLEPFISDEIVGVAKSGTLALRDGRASPREIAAQTLLVREPRSSTRRARPRTDSSSSTSITRPEPWPSGAWAAGIAVSA